MPDTTLPRGLVPRGLTKDQAAAYVGCATVRTFEAWVSRGLMPPAMPSTLRWDKRALDLAMDRLSGIATPGTPCHADVLIEIANGPICEAVDAQSEAAQ